VDGYLYLDCYRSLAGSLPVRRCFSLLLTFGVDLSFLSQSWMIPVYSALHTIPPILFRSKAFRANPTKVLTKSFFGTLRSCSFLATFVMLFQGLVCAQRNVYYALDGKVPEWMMKIWLHKGYYWVSGEFCSVVAELGSRRRMLTRLANRLPHLHLTLH
jgi:hypothetical protein